MPGSPFTRLVLCHVVCAFTGPVLALWLAATLYLAAAVPVGPVSPLEPLAGVFTTAAPPLLVIGPISALIMVALSRLWNPPALVWATMTFAIVILCCMIWQSSFGSITHMMLRNDLSYLLKPAALFAVLSTCVQTWLGPKRPGVWP